MKQEHCKATTSCKSFQKHTFERHSKGGGYTYTYLFITHTTNFLLMAHSSTFLSPGIHSKRNNFHHFQMSESPESVYLYCSPQVYPPITSSTLPLKNSLVICHRPLNSPLNSATQHITFASYKSLLLFIPVNIIPVLTCSEGTLNSGCLLWNTLSAV